MLHLRHFLFTHGRIGLCWRIHSDQGLSLVTTFAAFYSLEHNSCWSYQGPGLEPKWQRNKYKYIYTCPSIYICICSKRKRERVKEIMCSGAAVIIVAIFIVISIMRVSVLIRAIIRYSYNCYMSLSLAVSPPKPPAPPPLSAGSSVGGSALTVRATPPPKLLCGRPGSYGASAPPCREGGRVS